MEKSWHVIFGEPAALPIAARYDALRSPNRTLRAGGRFYEVSPQGKCTVGQPPPDAGPEVTHGSHTGAGGSQ